MMLLFILCLLQFVFAEDDDFSMDIWQPTNVIRCKDWSISWHGGTPPYRIILYPIGPPASMANTTFTTTFTDPITAHETVLGSNLKSSPFKWHVTQSGAEWWWLEMIDGARNGSMTDWFQIEQSSDIKCPAPVGVIVGPVIGALLALVAATLGFLFYRRQKRRSEFYGYWKREGSEKRDYAEDIPPAVVGRQSFSPNRSIVPLSTPSTLSQGVQPLLLVVDQDDDLGRYATAHRSIISHGLEDKLRRAKYLPTDDPKEISADVWMSQYGVGRFELKRLQELYNQNYRAVE